MRGLKRVLVAAFAIFLAFCLFTLLTAVQRPARGRRSVRVAGGSGVERGRSGLELQPSKLQAWRRQAGHASASRGKQRRAHRGRAQGMPSNRNRNPYRGVGRDGAAADGEPTTGRKRDGPVLGCEQFHSSNFSWPEGLRSIAVVGNGPLTEASRAEIEAADFVIRFNKLQSYRCGERFDAWASRHGDGVTTRYWGIGQKLNISGCPTGKLLQLARHIWLLNGGDAPFQHFLRSYPEIKERGNYAWLDCRRWVGEYLGKYDPRRRLGGGISSQDEVNPSSGWLVMMMVRDCAPLEAKVHVFGFNWPQHQWPAHKVAEEEAEIRGLERRGKLTIHSTQCRDKYNCTAADSRAAAAGP